MYSNYYPQRVLNSKYWMIWSKYNRIKVIYAMLAMYHIYESNLYINTVVKNYNLNKTRLIKPALKYGRRYAITRFFFFLLSVTTLFISVVCFVPTKCPLNFLLTSHITLNLSPFFPLSPLIFCNKVQRLQKSYRIYGNSLSVFVVLRHAGHFDT